MMGHTHALFGAAALVVAAPWIAPQPPSNALLALYTGAAVAGALAPDLDAEDSTILRRLGPFGGLTKIGLKLLGVKHRGVLHSGLALIAVTVGAVVIGGWLGDRGVGLAFALGWISHVAVADALTLSGVPLFWPGKRRFHLLPRPLRIRTGGPVEGLLFGAVSVGLLWLLKQ